MTEKEKREKAKREKAIGALSRIVCDGCGACFGCFAKRGWENLYDYIIRKSEEVKKERAREIINYIKALIVEPFYSVEICEQDLHHIAEKFGVEVEE